MTKELEISLKSIKGAQKRVKGSFGEGRFIDVFCGFFHLSREEEPLRRPFTVLFCLTCFSA